MVEFRFGDVVVDDWSIFEPPDSGSRGGWVDFFDWDGHRTFTLRSESIVLTLTAVTLHVRTTAPTWQPTVREPIRHECAQCS